MDTGHLILRKIAALHIGYYRWFVAIGAKKKFQSKEAVNRTLKSLLWISAVIVIPGLGLALFAKKLLDDSEEKEQFKKYVHKTYGYASHYRDSNDS